MKTLKIKIASLDCNNARRDLGRKLKAMKVSFEQAMRFTRRFETWSELVTYYGSKNLLKEGERYKGYLIVSYQDGVYRPAFEKDCFLVVYMEGSLRKVRDSIFVPFDEENWQAYCDDKYWTIGGWNSHTGVFRLISTWGTTSLIHSAEALHREGFISQDISPDEIVHCIENKMTEACASLGKAELSDDEYKVVRRLCDNSYWTAHLKIDIFEKFLVEVNEAWDFDISKLEQAYLEGRLNDEIDRQVKEMPETDEHFSGNQEWYQYVRKHIGELKEIYAMALDKSWQKRVGAVDKNYHPNPEPISLSDVVRKPFHENF